MKQPSITIQNGHRHTTTGQTGTAGEVDLIDKVFYELSPLLIKAGVVVYYDDANVINGQNTDYFIALHFDGATNPSYKGGFIDDAPKCPNNGVTPCDNSSDASWKFAQKIADYYFSAMGIDFVPGHRTVNSTYYYAFNYTGEKTLQFIIELGTLTNPDDRGKLQDYKKIATLLSQGIIAYLTENDLNYKQYLASQAIGTDKAEIERLRIELQAQKDSYTKLQQTTTKQLADKDTECQSYKSRLQDIKTYVANK